MNLENIQKYIDEKLVTENTHPVNPSLKIYNYTHVCQFDKIWDDVTLNCRGLIYDTNNNKIVARPFPKFFNIEEHINVFHKEVPDEKPIITEKLDGSLGILYWVKDEPWIATRGSFESDQALWATEWFRKNVNYDNIPRNITFLFEIIYHENRIVVNYDFEGLVLLAALETESGAYIDYTIDNVRKVKKIDNTDLKELSKMNSDNAEGFVVFYPKSNLRLKIKFPEYVRLHKILTGLSVKGIWEYLKEYGPDTDIRKIAEDAPDEFYDWLDSVASEMIMKYKEILKQCETDFNLITYSLIDSEKTRKDWALKINECAYPSILYAMLDNKEYDNIIWKMIKPKVEDKSFKKD